MERKSWANLTEQQKRTLSGAMSVQIVLLTLALIDIARRPKSDIKGSKPVWVLVSFVNFAGPVSYFIFGRKK